MSDVYIVEREDLVSVADTIRAKGETQAELNFPNGFKSAINAISTGIPTSLLDNNGTRTDFSGMFKDCALLTELPDLDVSSAVNMTDTFMNCTNLLSPSFASLLQHTNNVKVFNNTFFGCVGLVNIVVNTNSAEQCVNMFASCSHLKNILFNTLSNAVNMTNAFLYCDELTGVQITTTNCIKCDIAFPSSNLSVASLVSIANALNGTVNKSLQLNSYTYILVASIFGHNENGTFVQSGTELSILDFITNVKGWSVTR